jgi:hypothetical protein
VATQKNNPVKKGKQRFCDDIVSRGSVCAATMAGVRELEQTES